MYTNVTILPAEQIIIVDGTPLHFLFTSPLGVTVLSWHNGKGRMEKGGTVVILSGEADYKTHVAPLVTLWEAEKTRLEKNT